MAWQDDVNATWRDAGREVVAKFEFIELYGVPSTRWKGEFAHICEGKLVKKPPEWIVTLEYIVERQI